MASDKRTLLVLGIAVFVTFMVTQMFILAPGSARYTDRPFTGSRVLESEETAFNVDLRDDVVVPIPSEEQQDHSYDMEDYDNLKTEEALPDGLTINPLPTFAGGWTPQSFPIGMIAYNRPHYLREAMNSLLQDVQFMDPKLLTVYQDGFDENVTAVALDYPSVNWVHHNRTPLYEGAANIAKHYRHVLNHMFRTNPEAKYVIVLEDDMIFSPDFLLYFAQLANVMDNDPTVWCISSWNDNGFGIHSRNPKELYRTDFMIGLGWLVPRHVWDEVEPIWPVSQWDHWMRKDTIRKGRQCIYPEMNRNYNIGVKGTHSNERLFTKYFSDIALQREPAVDLGDTTRMYDDRYEEEMMKRIIDGQQVVSFDDFQTYNDTADLVMFIALDNVRDKEAWLPISAYFTLWQSVPVRGMYKGTLTFWHKENKLILVTPFSPYYKYKQHDTPLFTAEQFKKAAKNQLL